MLPVPAEERGTVQLLMHLSDLAARVEALRLPPPHVGAEFEGIGRLPDALELLQSGESVGKVVVHVTDADVAALGGTP